MSSRGSRADADAQAFANRLITAGMSRPAARGFMVITGFLASLMTFMTQSISQCMRNPAAL